MKMHLPEDCGEDPHDESEDGVTVESEHVYDSSKFKRGNWRCFFGLHDWTDWTATELKIVLRVGDHIYVDDIVDRRCVRCGKYQAKA